MLVGLSDNGDRIIARDATRDLHYFCPACSESLILKKGEIKIHHFAHKPDSTCLYAGETIDHLQAKLQIYDSLKSHPFVISPQLEIFMETTRADIIFNIDTENPINTVVIEVQNSPIDQNTILSRMSAYKKLNTAVLWVIPSKQQPAFIKPTDDGGEWKVPKWQLMIHSLGLNRIYYHMLDMRVNLVHFTRIIRIRNCFNPETQDTWTEEVELKTTKKLSICGIANIVDDFEVKKSPYGYLWSDKYNDWWQ